MSLKAMIAAAEGQDRRSIRDRAILALGLAAALRHSKTDQEGEGQVIAVPAGKVLKPVDRLKAWMAVRGNGAGPLFYQIGPQGRLTDQSMSDCSVARLIQKYAGGVGLDPETVGCHSLRAEFLTEASRNGATIAKMQEVSRHKKIEMLLRYVRSAELFDDHAGASFLCGMRIINVLIYR